MTAQEETGNRRFFWPVAIAGLLPWFFVQIQMSVNGDTAWLALATRRLLAGESMVSGFYEVNPPLSTLYYIPPVWLGSFLPVPEYYIIFFYFLALIALSAFALHAIIQKMPFLDDGQRQVLLATYLAGNTIFTAIALGEREHVVLLGLVPFLLAQLCLTWGYTLPKKLLAPVMVLGTIAVLIKPHFGLLPTILLIHRLIVQKRLRAVLFAPDFLALAVGTLAYAAIVWLFFQDYIKIILPDVMALYVPNRDYASALPELLMHSYLFLIFMGIEAFFTPMKGRQKHFLILFYVGALCALIPYAVQMKGFYYQLLPALIIFFCGFTLSLHAYAIPYLQKLKWRNIAIVAAIFVVAYAGRPLLASYPRHNEYKSLPLSQEIAKCEEPCPYFLFHDGLEILQPTAYYSGREHASRFPSYWFLPKLVQEEYKRRHNLPATLTYQEISRYKKKFGDMTAEDWARYQPKMLIIGRYRLSEDEDFFDFAGFFSGASPQFRKEWNKFRKDRTVTMNRRPYFAGTTLDKDHPMVYDIYIRK